MASLSKKRKCKNRAKTTGADDRYYLGQKNKEAKYGMFNSSMRMDWKEKDKEKMKTLYEEEAMDEMYELIERLESLRLDYTNIYGEPRAREFLIAIYEKANEMLDDCIAEVKAYFTGE